MLTYGIYYDIYIYIYIYGNTCLLCMYICMKYMYILYLPNRCRQHKQKHISSTKHEIPNHDVDIETNVGYSILLQNRYHEEDSLYRYEDAETCRPPPRDTHREEAIPNNDIMPVCCSKSLHIVVLYSI